MKFFRYDADKIPVLIITGFFLVDLVAFFLIPTWWGALIWFLLGIAPKACISSWNHHHQHLPTFHQPFMNRAMEIVYGFSTGITTNAWFLHHVVGHHKNYLDQEKDESRWKRKSGKTMNVVEYSFVVAATGYPRALMVGLRFRKHLRAFLIMQVVQWILFGMLCWHNPINAVFIFLLPGFVSLYITAWHTYYHHADLDTDDHYQGSNNITHHWYNILTGNLGFHTAHHIQGGLHWSKLPEYHLQIAHKIPAERFHKPCWPFSWMGSKKMVPDIPYEPEKDRLKAQDAKEILEQFQVQVPNAEPKTA
ncbi:MAG: fatty acid desaturase [Lentisphaeria bacterium]|nr:fatty acid desaturase [Lentisphaeria bacterium]